MSILERVAARRGEMTGWRHELHAHPELGFEEHRTADFVAGMLAGFGIEVHRGIGKTGLVGRLCVGNSPRTIGLRADMDCLPIQESNDIPHRSRYAGRMHACGHDGHTAMLLGAARYLAETRNFDGTVHFIFQPAEEGLGGARAMVDEGLFERFPCEAVFGMHNRPGLAVGRFQSRVGAMMSGGEFFDITITGIGSHGARPEAAVDPIVVGSQIATALQTVVSRNVRPIETAVVSITHFHAGRAHNVIPDKAVLGGTVRCFNETVMTLIEQRMHCIVESIAAGFGAKAVLQFHAPIPVLANHTDEVCFVLDCAAELVGEENINRAMTPSMASEDFAFMLQAVPGAYIQIGNGDGEGACEVHNPEYDFNDAALPYGAALHCTLVERRLGRIGRI